MKAIFLSDISTADGRYLENFVFNPGVASGFDVYLPTRKAHQGGLGYLDRFLAWLYNHRGKTEDAPGKLD